MNAKGSTRADRSVKYLTQEQVTALFRAARKRSTRDRLLLAFIYRFALRTQEACALPCSATA